MIRIPEIRVIDSQGNNLGVMSSKEALRLAREQDLDLVEISPNANPPVCRIVSFGKFLYERTKKEKEAKKAQAKVEVKEIRLRPKTNEHHRSFKTRDARRWLMEKKKVRVTIRFRGREITYPELALEDLKEIAEELRDIAIIEQPPAMEGRVMRMLLGPDVKKIDKLKAEIAAHPELQAALEAEPEEDYDDEEDDELDEEEEE
jgi:translation initiation factor IF-3